MVTQVSSPSRAVEGGEGGVRVECGEPAAAQPRGAPVASAMPPPPMVPRQSRSPGGPAPAAHGEGVEVGVRGGVGGLPAAPPNPEIEENSTKSSNASPSRRVSRFSAPAVFARTTAAKASGSCRPALGGPYAGRVDDRPDRRARRGGLHVRYRVRRGRLRRRPRSWSARLSPPVPPSRRTRRIVAAAADEKQVFGAFPGEPARDLPAQGAGATGDQCGAARRRDSSCGDGPPGRPRRRGPVGGHKSRWAGPPPGPRPRRRAGRRAPAPERSSGAAGRSTTPPQRSGYSSAATRPRPPAGPGGR